MRRLSASGVRLVHSGVAAHALPALAEAPKPGFLGSLFGGGGPAQLPPMTEPLAGVHAPPYAPPATAPTTAQKKLSNGAIIAAEETPGSSVSLGLYVDSGSKYEDAFTAGASQVIERLAFKSTHNRSAFRLTREAEVIGANLLASGSREQLAFTADVLRTHLSEGTELLLDAVLNPKFDRVSLAAAVTSLKRAAAEADKHPESGCMEALHAAAYGASGLGRPLAADAATLDRLTPDALAEFVATTFTAPRLALAASGAGLAQLAAVAEPLLGSLPPSAPPARGSAVDGSYAGGELRLSPGGASDGLTHIALAFHAAGGWRDMSAATAVTVLQMMLGGGNSFSAGGPGKGLYSRLYRNVLNKHAWAHACTGFHSMYNDTGLVGISASADPSRAGDALDAMVKELQAIATPGGISSADLARAKAATRSSVLMNLESRAVVAEDIGRQALTYGERKPPAAFLAAVDAVTPAVLTALVAKLLKTPPSLAVVGDAHALPRYEALARRLA